MESLRTLALLGHLLAVVVLVGSTVIMALVILPAIGRGRLSATAVRELGQRFAIVTAVSGAGVLLTGVYASSLEHTLSALVTTPSGWLTVASILVWGVLAFLLAVGTNRLAWAVAIGDVQRAAAQSRNWYNVAAFVAVAGVLVFGAL